MAKKDYEPASEKQAAAARENLEKANKKAAELKAEKDAEMARKEQAHRGKDPERPVPGSEAHYKKHGW